MAHRPPSYRLHRPTGQAVVTIAGRDLYLGRHGTAASKAEYDKLIAEWLSAGRTARDGADLTVNELMVRYLAFADTHYRDPDGKPGREVANLADALGPVRRLYGHTPASRFGPLAFKTVRQALVDAGLARSTINDRMARVRRMFKWAVANELVPASVFHGLQAVEGLRAGKGGAKEPPAVRPVPAEIVAATLPFLPPAVAAMVEVLALCGGRVGEVAALRPVDLDCTGDVWVYRPSRHKTAHKGKTRTIVFGPAAIAILRPWFDATPDPQAFVFSPARAEHLRLAACRAARVTQRTPSQAARTPKANPKRRPRDSYDKNAVGQAIRRACQKAGVECWHVHQLRHAAASRIRASHGLDAASAVLGHPRVDMTQHYAQRGEEVTRAVMRDVG